MDLWVGFTVFISWGFFFIAAKPFEDYKGASSMETAVGGEKVCLATELENIVQSFIGNVFTFRYVFYGKSIISKPGKICTVGGDCVDVADEDPFRNVMGSFLTLALHHPPSLMKIGPENTTSMVEMDPSEGCVYAFTIY